jgi:hypothetical protein
MLEFHTKRTCVLNWAQPMQIVFLISSLFLTSHKITGFKNAGKIRPLPWTAVHVTTFSLYSQIFPG